MSQRSPISGLPLHADTPWSLSDGRSERWPVVDGIPYLRVGREALVRDALAWLDAGRPDEALVLLLADHDDLWNGAPADPQRLRLLVRDRESLTFREAMGHLGFDGVGVYNAHRWTDPTFLAGLALLEAHWPDPAPGTAFELACGAGHYLRELCRRGVKATGADLVFAKLWLARHWIAGATAELICFDASAPWPTGRETYDLVLCQDAFSFLDNKPAVVEALRAMAGRGWVAVGHVKNADWPGLVTRGAVTAACIEKLFPRGVVYDDAELTRALVQSRAPQPALARDLKRAEAFSLVFGPGLHCTPHSLCGGLALPPDGALLRRNPLYQGSLIRWPTERYREEFQPRATYPLRTDAPEFAPCGPAVAQAARRRELVDLPERW
jgi:SAM-dependent methyltransferase